MARNVLANWAGYVLVLIAGFVQPRLIDHHQGQELLGVWDFAWSLAFYVSLLALGVTAAVQRYVARHRSVADWAALNTTVNSCLAILCGSALLGMIAAGGLAFAVPWLLPQASAATVSTARWVVLILAASAALQFPGGVFTAVITGYDRFVTLNIIRGIRDGVVLLAMVGLLLGGFGVVALAIAELLAETACSIAKVLVARRLCPTLQLSPRWCRRDVAKEMLVFGGKTVTQDLARGGLYQANSLITGYFLGPAALAVFARPRSLVMHLMRFIKQYAHVFIPSSSAFHAVGDTASLRRLLITSSKYGFYGTLPAAVIMMVCGGPLLELWMGGDYSVPLVLAVLTAGHVCAVPQMGVSMILLGMGKHGFPALLELVATALGVVLALIGVGVLKGGLPAAALAVALPIAVNGGIVIPLYACRLVDLSPRRYWREVLPGPLLANLPLAGLLTACQIVLAGKPKTALAWGLALGGAITAVVYWRWVLPSSIKAKLRQKYCRSLEHARRRIIRPDGDSKGVL